MAEYTFNYELDPELEKLLRETHSMLYDYIKSRKRPLSDKMINSKKLREELGISAKTEYTYRTKGILKGKKIGSKWYYDPSEIIEIHDDSDSLKDARE
jgi:hypothetical protein